MNPHVEIFRKTHLRGYWEILINSVWHSWGSQRVALTLSQQRDWIPPVFVFPPSMALPTCKRQAGSSKRSATPMPALTQPNSQGKGLLAQQEDPFNPKLS